LAHATGLLSAVAIPVYTGCSVVLRDRWDADQAIEDMNTLGVTFSSGASIFIQEILAALAARGQERLELSGYPCGGSTIPTALAMAAEAVGMHPARSWGMTECPSVTSSAPFEPAEIRCGSDGRIAPGCEVRVVDADEKELGPDEIGDLLIRGPQRALGYLLAAHTAEAFDDEGWFRTGDLGTIDSGGNVRISGRLKDVIIRNAENISALEVEEVIRPHPAVRDVAVIGLPDPRTGERVCAVVVTESGQPLEFEELARWCNESGLSRYKHPERLELVDTLPLDGMGKVRKEILRAQFAPH
jgi:acyl-CoA synthetase